MLDPEARLHPLPGDGSIICPRRKTCRGSHRRRRGVRTVSGERGAVEEEWSWRTGKAKVGARLSLIVDVPGSTASGVTVCSGSVRGTVLVYVGHWHQMTPNPKPQDHHKANVDSCAALQVIDSFLRNRGGQIRVPGKLGEYQNVFRINVRWESRSSAAAARDHRPERMESWVGTRSTVLHGDETHRRY